MSDLEFEYHSDQDVSENHSKLLEAVTQLDKGQRVKKPQRSEPSLEVSEFHLVKSGVGDKNAVHLRDLAKTLGQRASHADISRKFRAAQRKSKILLKPLEKPAAARIKRTVGFENVKKELGKWDAVVSKNRTAEQLRFPLKQSSMRLETTNQFVKRFRIQSDLEKELAALEPKKIETKADEVEEFPMSLEEIIERRKEAAKLRAQQSYKEAKAYRQNKIKSKKFHRIQRKERTKQQLKEFEELMKTNPEAALSKLEQLEKSRAEERMSLRHKSTGQWAKNQQIRAKYDKESRQVLAQQLSISRDLTQKIQKDDDSEDEEDVAIVSTPADKENPWINGSKSPSEIDDFISGYRKYWDDKNKLKDPKVYQEKDDEKAGQKNIEETFVVPQIEDLPKALNPVEEVIIERSNLMFNDDSVDTIDHDTDESDSQVYEETPTKKRKTVKSPISIKSSNESISKKSKSDSIKPVSRSRTDPENLQNGSLTKKSEKPLVAKPNKKSSKKKKVGTSDWAVTPTKCEASENESAPSKSLEIDEMFNTIEDKIQAKATSKLRNIKNKFTIKLDGDKKKTDDHIDSDNEYTGDLGFKNKKQRPIIDEQMNETSDKVSSEMNREISMLKNLANTDLQRIAQKSSKEVEIDPNKFINVKPKHLKTQLPDMITGGDEGLDDSDQEDDRQMIISEAFADDDVVEEFRKEKGEEVKKGQPDDIDLSLPGWGSWGGKNLAISKRKKRRFLLKFPKDAPRKDENKGDVIIMEEKDPKIKEHQVTEIPFPFTSVKDFEASIRAPLGRTFVPENAHRKLIRPAVVTKMGRVIEPMDEESLVHTKNTKDDRKRLPGKKGKKRNARK